jgi:hypothetical protein
MQPPSHAEHKPDAQLCIAACGSLRRPWPAHNGKMMGGNFLRRLEEATRAEVRLDDVQFALSALQPRAASVGFVRVVAFNSAPRRLHAVSCAIEVG